MPPFLPLRGTLSATEDTQYFLFPKTASNPGLPCSQSLYSLSVHKFYRQMTYFKQRRTAITTTLGLAYQLEEISKKKTISQGRLPGSRTRSDVITGLGVPSFQKGFAEANEP